LLFLVLLHFQLSAQRKRITFPGEFVEREILAKLNPEQTWNELLLLTGCEPVPCAGSHRESFAIGS